MSWSPRNGLLLALASALMWAGGLGLRTAAAADTVSNQAPPAGPLLLAFASLRDTPYFSQVYFYLHDGVSQGQIVGSIPPDKEAAHYRPSLSAEGRCAYAIKQTGGFPGRIGMWDFKTAGPLPAPPFEGESGSRLEPALSADGRRLALAAYGAAQGVGGWDAYVYDLATGRRLEIPGLNTERDEREITLSADGRLLACSATPTDSGRSDVQLFDLEARGPIDLGPLNTPARELSPALTSDGRLVAFVSDRAEGAGGKDIYLFDREEGRLLPLAGLNSPAHEQTPALSPDGRYVAFVSERTSGAGERDIYLYDRVRQELLPTPGLNLPAEDFDPWLARVPEAD